MIKILNREDCCGCYACSQACPRSCIKMLPDEEGFCYPQVDESKCIDCGLCEKVCPVKNQLNNNQPLKVYAAINTNEEVRKESSSGGIFSLLAEVIISRNGVVFGAMFDDNWNVIHSYTESMEGLQSFRSSKYLQSKIGDCYKEAKAFLLQDRWVLFSGTPCQIRGLKLFLGREFDRLITIDVICHGVPSPAVFHQYLNEMISLNKENEIISIKNISFRDKSRGWKNYHFTLDFLSSKGDSHIYSCEFRKNPFIKGFIKDIYLRYSCYQCPTRNLKSGSDITLGDFWKVNTLLPSIDDDKGISAVSINSSKGMDLFSELDKINKWEATWNDLKKRNFPITKSPKMPKSRSLFFTRSDNSIISQIELLTKPTLIGKLKHVVKAIKTRFFD